MPTYNCIVFRQRPDTSTPEFCIFHAPVGEVLAWSDIKRLDADPGGAQRSLNETRIRSVSRFLEDGRNTIPTSVIVALDIPHNCYPQGNGPRYGDITIEATQDAEKPGTVIDGQHRLVGIAKQDPSINVAVVALLTDDLNESAFQFFIINNKAARVPTDHIKALLAERADESLKERLRKARLSISPTYEFVATADNDDESPFRALVDWPTNRTAQKWVKPAAIENAVRNIQERKVREFDAEDAVIEFFFTLWRTVKSQWATLWNENSRLLSKVGIVCMTQYLTNLLVGAYDIGELDVSNLDSIERRVRSALQFQKEEFWTVQWSSSSYDTIAGHKQVVESLVQVSRNLRAGVDWKEDVAVLAGSPSA